MSAQAKKNGSVEKQKKGPGGITSSILKHTVQGGHMVTSSFEKVGSQITSTTKKVTNVTKKTGGAVIGLIPGMHAHHKSPTKNEVGVIDEIKNEDELNQSEDHLKESSSEEGGKLKESLSEEGRKQNESPAEQGGIPKEAPPVEQENEITGVGGLTSSSILKHTIQNDHELTSPFEKVGTQISSAMQAVAGTIDDVTKKTGEVVIGFVKNPLNLTSKNKGVDNNNYENLNNLSSGAGGIQETVFHVEPDEVLPKMDIILKTRLKGVSVEQFHEHIWKNADFYKGWLGRSGKDQITIQPWEALEGGYHGEWKDDTTQYVERREVDFSFTRTTHLYTGPPVAQVHQIHLGKLTEDRSVVQIQVSMDGIPFADCFNVQIRWVATRITNSQTEIDVGLYVNFVQQTILAGKIRSGTAEETTKTQQSLLKSVVEECGKVATDSGTSMEVDDCNDDETMAGAARDVGGADENICIALPKLFADLFKTHRSDSLGLKVQSVEHAVRSIVDLLDMTTDLDPQAEAKIDSELTDISEALFSIKRYIMMATMQKKKSSRDLFH